MADIPTRAELFARARAAALATPGSKISPKEIDRPGSDANLLFNAIALVGEEIANRAARALAGCFEDTAKGKRLDRVIFDRKSLPRKGAAAATVSLTLARATDDAGAGTIVGGVPGSDPQPSRVRTNRGIVYQLLSDVSFGATSLGPYTVTAQAELAGLDYEVDELQSWSWVDQPFDPTITITNTEAASGAAEVEEDDRYLARSRNFYNTVHRGTQDAIDAGLQAVPGVDVESSEEIIDPSNGYPAGRVRAFVLDRLGRADSTLAARGRLALNSYRALGVPVFVEPSVPEFVEISFSVSFDTRIVQDSVQQANRVKAAVVAALENQRPGQSLLRSTIIAAIKSVPGAVMEDSDLLVPTATLLPTAVGTAFRTKLELVRLVG